MTNYKCSDCGHEFTGDDYTLECPSCSSTRIAKHQVSGGGKLLALLKNNKRVATIISVSITVILLLSLKNCGTESGGTIDTASKELRIKTNNEENYIAISIYDVSDNKRQKIEFYDNPQLYVSAGFKAYQNGEQLSVIEGTIYPCTSDAIKLTWSSSIGLSNTSKIINNFKLKSSVSKNASCREKLTLRVKPSACECKFEVVSNYDAIDPSETIMISINGRNGKYVDKREWTLSEKNNKYDVWGYIKGRDTIRAIPGKGSIKACISFNAKNYERIARYYAKNPSNLNALSQFRSVTKSSFKILYKGQKTSINALSNKLRTEWMNNGTTFNVTIKWGSKGDCGDVNKTVQSINFN